MSKELEAIEKAAYSGVISSPEEIEEVIGCFLDMEFGKLAPMHACTKKSYTHLVKELTGGYDIDAKRLERHSIRDILQLIGSAPQLPWFNFVNEGKWPDGLGSRTYLKASDLYVSLLESAFFVRKEEYASYKLMNVSIDALFHLLKRKSLSTEQYRSLRMSEYGFWQELKEYYNMERSERTMIKDVITKEIALSLRPWFFFVQDIDAYMRNMIFTSEVTSRLMTAVKQVYVPEDEAELNKIVTDCSLHGDFPENDVLSLFKD